MPNLCGVNQKLLAEALSSVKRGVYIFLFVSAPYTFLSCPGTTSGASTPAELHISMMQPSRPLKNRDQWFLYLVDTIIVHRPSFPPHHHPTFPYLFIFLNSLRLVDVFLAVMRDPKCNSIQRRIECSLPSTLPRYNVMLLVRIVGTFDVHVMSDM